jgi:hypothetical protein
MPDRLAKDDQAGQSNWTNVQLPVQLPSCTVAKCRRHSRLISWLLNKSLSSERTVFLRLWRIFVVADIEYLLSKCSFRRNASARIHAIGNQLPVKFKDAIRSLLGTEPARNCNESDGIAPISASSCLQSIAAVSTS